MPRLSPLDAMFLYVESPETMMHVGGLLQFTPTETSAPELLQRIRDEITSTTHVEPPWNMKLQTPGLMLNPLHSWVVDKNFDLTYHVRRSALPSPGDERELGILVSRLHSRPLDLSRSPWETYVIEGLEGGRVALYIKVHHSLVDGYTAMKILSRAMSDDPAEKDTKLFFQVPKPKRTAKGDSDDDGVSFDTLLRTVGGSLTSVKDVGTAVFRAGRASRNKDNPLVGSLQAPHTIFNGRISRNRRFATQQYEIPRLKTLAKAAGGTLNDIVLAICAGGLRHYLMDVGELPEQPLIAFLPVNVRPKDDPGGGNAVGGLLASLATDIADPKQRFEAIIASTRAGKAQLEGMTQAAIMAYTTALLGPFLAQSAAARAGVAKVIPATYNVIISNVPGPRKPMYFRGNRMDSVYPVSIPIHGVALNITCESYDDTLNFGFIGCRDAVPHLQRLAVYSGEALDELEAVLV